MHKLSVDEWLALAVVSMYVDARSVARTAEPATSEPTLFNLCNSSSKSAR